MLASFLLAVAIASGTPHHHATAEGQSPLTDPDKFDLICQMQSLVKGTTGTPIHLHLDLGTRMWCDDFSGCQPMTPIMGVSDQRIELAFKVSQTPLGVETSDQWIDRATGRYHATDSFGSEVNDRLEGACEKLPYMSAPKRAF